MKNEKVVAWIDGPLSQALMNDQITDATVEFIKQKEINLFSFMYLFLRHIIQNLHSSHALRKLLHWDVRQKCPKKAQIAVPDVCVGKVMDILKELGIHNKTMMIYQR